LLAAGAANAASLASAQNPEKHRASLRSGLVVQVAGKPSGSPFFWVLFFGEAKKSTSPEWAKQQDEKTSQ
jgi:hypothetical protein